VTTESVVVPPVSHIAWPYKMHVLYRSLGGLSDDE
jgi:hypothetical protein